MMIILNIAQIDDNMCGGVQNVVPQHVTYQSYYAKTALYNIKSVMFDGITCYLYKKVKKIKDLEYPFNNPDIVIFHEIYSFPFILLAKECVNRKIPYIIVPHGGLTKQAQHTKYIKKKVANILFFNRYINSSISIQFLSEVERNDSKKYCKIDNFIGTNGITKRSFNKTKRTIPFLFIGRIDVNHKGIDLLFEAVNEKRLIFEKNCWTIEMYGPFESEKDKKYVFEFINNHNLNNIIKIHGPVFGNDKYDLYLKAKMFIQTSRYEGMPMGILEALSFGTPVFITEGTTLGDYVLNYNAGVVAQTSSESIANLFQRIDSENICDDVMSQRAVSLINDIFSWEIVARNNVKKYEEIAYGYLEK